MDSLASASFSISTPSQPSTSFSVQSDGAARLTNPAERLLEKRREIFKVQNELDEQKIIYQQKEAEFRDREVSLKQRDIELQESLVRFSKFLQESDAKRVRATKKAAEERRMKEEKTKEAYALADIVDGLKEQKEEAQTTLRKYIKYKNYLENVLEVTERFSTIDDLLARHSTLEAANDDLRQQQWKAADLTEKLSRQTQLFVKTKTDEILHHNNTISRLKKELEDNQREVYGLEAKKDKVVQAAAERTREIGQVCLSIDGLYNRCKLAAFTQPLPTLAQVDVIGNHISDLALIVREARLHTSGATSSPSRDGARLNAASIAAKPSTAPTGASTAPTSAPAVPPAAAAAAAVPAH